MLSRKFRNATQYEKQIVVDLLKTSSPSDSRAHSEHIKIIIPGSGIDNGGEI